MDCELRDKAYKICYDHLGGAWRHVSPSEISITPITGGMSNLLYCCSLPESIQLANGEPSQVLLRLYGDQSRNCDMSLQVQIFKLLSFKELGPKLYADFEDGRLEEFLPAHSLTCEELMNRDISTIIAKKLAIVHSLDVPMDKSSAWIMDRFKEWLEFIETQERPLKFPEGTRETTIEIANELLKVNFSEEIKFLRQVFDGTRSPIVFSHNDLHQGNILLATPTKRRPLLEKRVILIDFEYCSYNYRAYDIANHFCEWCFEYDTPEYPHFALYQERFPSNDIQHEFVRNYLDQQKQLRQQQQANNNDEQQTNSEENKNRKDGSSNINGNSKHCDNDGLTNGHHNHSHPNGLPSTNGLTSYEEIEAILKEIKTFCMAANLVWTLWCIKTAHSSNIKFGYWEHAMTRWRLYSSLKVSYLKERAHTNGSDIPKV